MKQHPLESALRLLVMLLIFILPAKLIGQVQVQTGSAVQSVPIFQYADPLSRLQLPISINYNSGQGFKPDEIASDVGQGWGLMAGGKIIRIQAGEPDDQIEVSGSSSNMNKYPGGRLTNNILPQNGIPNRFNQFPIFRAENTLYKNHHSIHTDREPDMFAMSLNGTSALFVLYPTNGLEGEGVFLGESLLRVTYKKASLSATTQSLPQEIGLNEQARTIIASFTIYDENGIKYTFDKKGFSRMMKISSSDPTFQQKSAYPKKYRWHAVYNESYFQDDINNPWIVNEWNLTEIEDPFSIGRKIELNYDYRDMTIWNGLEVQFVQSTREYGKLIGKKTRVIQPVLTSITCPQQGYSITFQYSAESRKDLPGAKALTSVKVVAAGRTLQQHDLTHQYVMLTRYGKPVTDIDLLTCRLYLTAIVKRTIDLKDTELPMQFDYYLGGGSNTEFVPPPNFVVKDIWGFYNGCNLFLESNGKLNPNDKELFIRLGRSAFLNKSRPTMSKIKRLTFKEGSATAVGDGFAKFGLLKRVIFPTGGHLEYSYEQNKAVYFEDANLYQVEQSVGGVHVSQTTLYDGGYNNNCTTGGLITTYDYKRADGFSSLWGVERPENTFMNTTKYQPASRKMQLKLPNPVPKCDYRFKYAGITQQEFATRLNNFEKVMASDITKSVQVALQVLSYIGYISDLADVSTATGVGTIVGLIVEAVVSIFELGFTCWVMDDWKTHTQTVSYNYDLKSANPLPIQFSRVTVTTGGTTAGKTVQEFTDFRDYPIWVPAQMYGSRQQRYASWAYGLNKRTATYDASGKIITETINTYRLCNNNATSFQPHWQTDKRQYRSGPSSAENDFYSDAEEADRSPFAFEATGTDTSNCLPTKRGINIYGASAYVTISRSVRGDDWSSSWYYTLANPADYTTTGFEGMQVRIYQLYTGRAELLSSIDKVYDQQNGTGFMQTEKRYTYSDTNYMPKTVEEIKPSGEHTITKLYYNVDQEAATFSSSTAHSEALTTLAINGIKNVQVAVKTGVRKLDSYENLFVNLRVSELGMLKTSNGYEWNKPVISLTKVKRTATPLSETTFDNLPFETEPETQLYYNAEGFNHAARSQGGRTTVSVYDYEERLVTATAINASNTDAIAYTSFETTTTSGGWNITGGTFIPGLSYTGNKHLQLAATPSVVSNSVVANGKKQTLSFWATSNAVTISGATIVSSITGPTRFGYTYYQYLLTGTGAAISISGTAKIDELRTFPANARMNTTTYDPYIGKTAVTDQNSRSTYYEYDSRGRLKLVKDDVGAIVSMYEYGEASKLETCPVTYWNNTIYYLAKRNNCSAGYEGGYFEDSVAANTVSSTISQAHADELAAAALAASAQTKANLYGTCSQIFSNVAMSGTFYNQNCDDEAGYEAQPYSYSVTQGKYFSLVSQAEADSMAMDDLEANGQALANQYGGCVATTNPVWIGDENQMRCKQVNGATTGETEMLFRDANPNSATYNQTQWVTLEENVLGCTSSAPCEGAHNRLVNGICELGLIYQVISYYDSYTQRYACEIVYMFSDNSIQSETFYYEWWEWQMNCPIN